MPGTDVRSPAEDHERGLSAATWAVILACVAVGLGHLLGEQTWVTPDWNRWWVPILGIEIAAYALTLFLPPTGRLTLTHGLLRIAVGMVFRLAVVLVNAAIRLRGGDCTYAEGVQVYWAAHWPAALVEVACVAVGVYWFRYLSVRRVQRARAAKQEAVPAIIDPSGRTREELVDELTSRLEEEAAPAFVAEPPTTSAPPEPVRETAPEVVEPPPRPPEPAPPAAAPVPAASELDTLHLPAAVVMRALPPSVLVEPADALAPQLSGKQLSFAWAALAPQLEEGEVRVPALQVLTQLPQAVLAGPAARLAEGLLDGVVLPLDEIVSRIPMEIFAPPPEQEPSPEIPCGPPIFAEGGQQARPPSPAVATPPAAVREAEPPRPIAPPPPAPEPEERPSPDVEPEPAAAEAAAAVEPEPVLDEATPVVSEEPPAEPEPPFEAEDETELERKRERALAAAVAALHRPTPVESDGEEAAPEAEPLALDEAAVAPEAEPEPDAPAGVLPLVLPPLAPQAPVARPPVALEHEREEPAGPPPIPPLPSLPGLTALRPAAVDAEEPAAELPAEPEPPAVAPVEEAVEAPEPVAAEEVPVEPPAEPEPPAVAPVEEAVEAPEPSVAEEVPVEPPAEPEPPAVAPVEEAVEAPEPSVVEEAAPEPSAALEPAAAAPEEAPGEPSAEFVLPADVEGGLLDALKSVGVLHVEAATQDGLTAVAAHGPARTPGVHDLAAAALAVAAAVDGELVLGVLAGVRGATFIGAHEASGGPYLVVTSESASAGQVSVAAKRALAALASIPPVGYRPRSAPSEASVDPELAALAAAADASAGGGYRTAEGQGVLIFAAAPAASPALAGAVAEAWRAAGRVCGDGVDRLLLVTSRGVVGIAECPAADVLVASSSDAGVNPGLAGTTLSRLVKACDHASRGGQ